MSETFLCSSCGGEHPISERITYDGKELCPDCLAERTTLCRVCGNKLFERNTVCGQTVLLKRNLSVFWRFFHN